MGLYNDSRKILRIAMPLLSSRLMNVISFFIGFIMIAKLGPEEFAAGGLASSIFFTLILISAGVLYAIGIKMSHAFGAKEYEKIREYFYSGVLLTIILSLFTIICMVAFAFLLPYLGQKPSLIPYAKKFLFALCLPIFPALLCATANQLVIAVLKTRIIFISSVINMPVCIGLLYIMIFGKLGFPPMGIWGFGLAFLLADTLLALIPIIYIFTHPYFKQFELTRFTNVGKNLIKRLIEIVKLGFPMGVQFGAELSAFAAVTFLIGRYGTNALAAYQIAKQIKIIAFMIPFTFAEAAAILVGQSLGRKDPIAVRNYGFSSCNLGGIFLLGVSVIFFTFPKLLTSIYINIHDPSLAPVVHLSVLFLYVGAISQLFDGARNIITGSLRGLHDSKSPMYIGIFISWCVGLPLGMLFAFPLKMGPLGFAFSYGIAFFVGAGILFQRFHRKTKLSQHPPFVPPADNENDD